MSLRISLIIAITLFLLSCTRLATTLEIQAAPRINLSHNGQALSVVCRAYLLRDTDEFKQASFKQLWHQDEKVLSQTLLAKKSWIQQPGSQTNIHFSYQASAGAIAIIALFRDPDSGTWRQVIPILNPKSWVSPTVIKIKENQLSVVEI